MSINDKFSCQFFEARQAFFTYSIEFSDFWTEYVFDLHR